MMTTVTSPVWLFHFFVYHDNGITSTHLEEEEEEDNTQQRYLVISFTLIYCTH